MRKYAMSVACTVAVTAGGVTLVMSVPAGADPNDGGSCPAGAVFAVGGTWDPTGQTTQPVTDRYVAQGYASKPVTYPRQLLAARRTDVRPERCRRRPDASHRSQRFPRSVPGQRDRRHRILTGSTDCRRRSRGTSHVTDPFPPNRKSKASSTPTLATRPGASKP